MNLKNLFAKVKNFVVNLFAKVDKTAKKFIPVGIQMVEAIKKFVDSDIADVIVQIIPGNLDNALKAFLEKVAPDIIINLRKWNSIIGVEDKNEKLKLIFEELKNLEKVDRDGIKTELATQFNTAILGFTNSNTVDLPVSDIKIWTLTAYHHPEVINEEAA